MARLVETVDNFSAVPNGTADFYRPLPSDKSLGYFHQIPTGYSIDVHFQTNPS
jgi:hypothetical protein